MSIHFHPVQIKEIKQETPDCISVEFEIPEKIKDSFQYKQGQSLTLRAFIDGQEVRRTYSLCSSPLDGEWKIAIKKIPGGVFSSFVSRALHKGDRIELMEPVGNFYTELNPLHPKNYLAFAAGSGITPVISIIKTTLQTEPQSRFTLVYGNRTRSSIIFLEELQGLKNKYIDRFQLFHILSRERTDTPLHEGRVDEEKLIQLSRVIDYTAMDEIFICGPEEMIFCIRNFLMQKGIGEKKIHFELFTTAGQKKKPQIRTRSLPEDREANSKITVKLDGRSFDFDIPLTSETPLLDAALQQGADLPYACKGGMCCTCKAKLLEGEVEMDVHWGLEEEEIKKGFILTCQSHPKTERVVVDFDIK